MSARTRGHTQPQKLAARMLQDQKSIQQPKRDFAAIDSQLVDLVFFLLLPVASDGKQLNALACVARKFRNPETVRHLRRAIDGAELYRAMQ
jgi:mannitol/fructose-specific phosphotransferase system IIA component (Ntr-type)